jgi:hypothetical protein
MADIIYVYRCTNRKCSEFKKLLESNQGPVETKLSTGNLPSCLKCNQVLELKRTIHPRGSFGKPTAEVIRKAASKADADIDQFLKDLSDA